MSPFREIIKTVLIIMLLTILTQVGGIIYLIYKPIGLKIKRKSEKRIQCRLLRLGIFTGMFLLGSLLIVPTLASWNGRVHLPILTSSEVPLRPANFLTVLGNRHYVKPALRDLIVSTSIAVNEKYPGTEILYLDANFPLLDEFPLLPHLSHDDGKKLDIRFIYKHSKTGKRINQSPTLLGYGYTEDPRTGEFDQISECEKKGYWQYSLLSKLSRKKAKYEFDEAVNQFLIQAISRKSATEKIFIEPHLKQRLGLNQDRKIRFHGCQAVRHDDHIHLQIR